MSWSKDERGGPRGYHHGNLKEALLGAALELIAKKGPAGFTFAEAARWAGVSPAAPYRHFRDRDELLANLALRGFERFAIVLEQAWDNGRPQPFTALDRLGKAYLEFARTEPSYYWQCLKPEFRLRLVPNCKKPGSGHLLSCVALLRSCVRKCRRSLAPQP
jgi:AcrR family transcriptional regulator